MRVIRYVGVMLIAGLVWAVISALLVTMGFGPTSTKIVGFLVLVLGAPVLFVLAAGTKASPADSVSTGEATAATNATGKTEAGPPSTEQAIQPAATKTNETKVQGIVRRVVDQLQTSLNVIPTTECWDDGNTCNIEVEVQGAHYKIQIMDPTGYQTIAWRLVDGEEITLGTEENSRPTELDRTIDQICRQVDQGRFSC